MLGRFDRRAALARLEEWKRLPTGRERSQAQEQPQFSSWYFWCAPQPRESAAVQVQLRQLAVPAQPELQQAEAERALAVPQLWPVVLVLAPQFRAQSRSENLPRNSGCRCA